MPRVLPHLEQQIDAAQSSVMQGVDAIVVTPIDQRALKRLAMQAQKKGIKWLTSFGKMDQSDGYVSFKHSQSGQIVAKQAPSHVNKSFTAAIVARSLLAAERSS